MIKVEQLEVRAGEFSLSGITFEIPTGSYGVLMGKTGSGKTTILEAICGLRKVTKGRIQLGSRDVTHSRAEMRGVGFVPQDGTLFSTMTVRQHLSFGPKIHGWAKEEMVARVDELAEQLAVQKLLDRKPAGLSGGERQRVSLGRAIAVRPAVLCLDEPLSALDGETHGEMLELLRKTVKENGITALHITHSLAEADRIGDCAFRLDRGELLWKG
ncbi:MAG: ATP-binding cassette domain-containing protein [Verrucomicrobiales bacterium]|nr:ATP-binding cassette domain-containing protein [Verrucomicrobiales bacterium]